MGTLANRDEPDEMPHSAAFHQGYHCLGQNNFQVQKNIVIWKF